MRVLAQSTLQSRGKRDAVDMRRRAVQVKPVAARASFNWDEHRETRGQAVGRKNAVED
jgi:hypothetical protein